MLTNNIFKKQLNFFVFGSVILLAILGGIVIYTVLSVKTHVENSQRISNALNNILKCQANQRSLLLNAWNDTVFVKYGTNDEFEIFKKNAQDFETNLAIILKNSSGSEKEELSKVAQDFILFKETFFKIGNLIKERGYKNLGLEGKLRIEAHRLETNALLKGNRSVLILRKHEKDFFLRKDLGYIEKLKQEADTLQTTLRTLPESTEQKELIAIFNLYMATMDKVVEIESEIGLTKSQGARATINTLSERIQQSLTHVNNTYKDGTEQLIFVSILIISGIFIFILGVILVALNKLVKPVFEPMHSIQEKAARISQGELSVQFNDLENNKVLKDLIVGFESIIAKFKNSMQLIEGIINRNIKEEIKLNSDNDEVGKTLNSIMLQVRTIDEEEQKRNWHNESLAKFAQVLRDSGSSSEQLYDSIITELVKNLGANQGAIYVVENDGNEEADPYLTLKSCYAYNRKKFINKRIDLGEGLTGTCWAEGATIFLTEVPPEYINITSGLGEASPNSVLLVPIKANEHVLGVIELASFGMFAQYKLKFVEVLSESIGAAINTSNTNIKTLHLLQRSQEMTEELRSQEEEMRQNMEEMQATQEEMKRMTEAVQIEIQKLRSENERLKTELNTTS